MYRVGYPFWKLVARLGICLGVRVRVYFDLESSSYWAESSDLDGLVVSGQSLDELYQEIKSAAHLLLELELKGKRARVLTEVLIQDTEICLV